MNPLTPNEVRTSRLERLGTLLDLEVVNVARVPKRADAPPKIHCVVLRDGRVVALGSDRHVRDRVYLNQALGGAGGNSHLTSGGCARVLSLLHRLEGTTNGHL